MTAPDHYQLLGVKRNADRRTVRVAYREALRRYHPDANAGDRQGEQMLRRVITAGRILCDPRQRARYDKQFDKTSSLATKTRARTENQPAVSGNHRLALLCTKILITSRLACKKFFNSEHATATENRRSSRQRQNPPDFNYYLHQAKGKIHPDRYQRDTDGIYRKSTHLRSSEQLRTWRNRTVSWLLLMILWEVWRS